MKRGARAVQPAGLFHALWTLHIIDGCICPAAPASRPPSQWRTLAGRRSPCGEPRLQRLLGTETTWWPPKGVRTPGGGPVIVRTAAYPFTTAQERTPFTESLRSDPKETPMRKQKNLQITVTITINLAACLMGIAAILKVLL